MTESDHKKEPEKTGGPPKNRPSPTVNPKAVAGNTAPRPKGPRKMRPMPVPRPHVEPPVDSAPQIESAAKNPAPDTVPISNPVAPADAGETSILSSPLPAAKPLHAANSEDSVDAPSDTVKPARRGKNSPGVLGGEIGDVAPLPAPAIETNVAKNMGSSIARANESSGVGWELGSDEDAAPPEDKLYAYESDALSSSPTAKLAPGEPVRLSIANLLPKTVLREMQDTYWASTRHPAFILDADGRPVVGHSPYALDSKANLVLNHLIDPETVPIKGPVMFPIVADGQRVGSVAFDVRHLPIPLPIFREKLSKYIASKGVNPTDVTSILRAAERVFAPHAGTAAATAIALAQQLSRLCEQEVALRERIEELGTLGHMTTLLAGERDLNHRLNAAVRSAVAVLNVKAACIRLYDEAANTLKVVAGYNLSREYMSQTLDDALSSPLTTAAFAGETVFIYEMSSDNRVVYQTRAVEEGLVSCMIVGLLYRNKPLGTFHVYTGERHMFSRSAAKLFISIAKLTASAIENWKRDSEVAENQRVQRQLKLASDVQRRMLPRNNPSIPGFEIDARYVPSFEIGGDFYDFINLGPNLGIAVGDVAGKGIAAGLLMAGVRASLRAYAHDLYDIDQVMSRVNRALAVDTLPSEFATVFFGVLDPAARRLTYCNAGHEPPLILRNGQVCRFEEGGMVVGVDPEQIYRRGIMDLRIGDLILFYTDGLPDAQNFDRQRFTKDRVIATLHECAKMTAKEAVSHMLWQMRRFVGMNHPTDDTTIVMIRVT